MYKKPSWLWAVFFFLYVFVTFNVTASFFEKNSPSQIYYQVLIGFNTFFVLHYLFNTLALILDIIAIIPFYNYIKPQATVITARYFSSGIWKWLLALRIGLLVVGRSYDFKQIQSIYRDDLLITFILITGMILLYAPSYYANFIFAYRQEKS